MIRALLREAAASARGQIVASALTTAVVAGMCAAVLLTTGQTVAAEHAALGAIDAEGTRSIVIRSSDDRAVTAATLDTLARIGGVESATGFGPIEDARNPRVPGGEPVPSRRAYGRIGDTPMDAAVHPLDGAALATASATATLGLRDGVGPVVTAGGTELEIVGPVALPDHLAFMEDVILRPSSTAASIAGADPEAPLAMIVVLAETPGHVAVLTAVLHDLLAGVDPDSVSIETSAGLAAIRQAVAGELGRFGRDTVLGILAVSAIVVGVNMFALAMLRRRDFGRRRALGATRGLILALLLAQVAFTAGTGAALGAAGTCIALALTGGPLPGWAFTVAVAVLGVLCAMAAATPPALWAASRDPMRELRVP